jgi:enoyl-CoA hydratase/carnithine racemase
VRALLAVKVLLVAALLVVVALAADLVIHQRWLDFGLLLVAVALLAGSYGAQRWARRHLVYGPLKGRQTRDQRRR